MPELAPIRKEIRSPNRRYPKIFFQDMPLFMEAYELKETNPGFGWLRIALESGYTDLSAPRKGL